MSRLRSIFQGKTDDFWVQFVRYFVAGGLAFVVDFSALYVFTVFLHIHYLVSAALSFGIGLAVNYSISILWVFNSRVVQNRGLELAIFALLAIIGLGLNELIMYIATEFVGLYFMHSKIVATGFTFVFNFLSRRIVLFAPAEDEVPFAELALDGGPGFETETQPVS
jgi:putative flippase GtrA